MIVLQFYFETRLFTIYFYFDSLVIVTPNLKILRNIVIVLTYLITFYCSSFFIIFD